MTGAVRMSTDRQTGSAHINESSNAWKENCSSLLVLILWYLLRRSDVLMDVAEANTAVVFICCLFSGNDKLHLFVLNFLWFISFLLLCFYLFYLGCFSFVFMKFILLFLFYY